MIKNRLKISREYNIKKKLIKIQTTTVFVQSVVLID